MVISIMDPTTRNKLPQLTAYKYDQLNRLTQMKAYSDITANAWDNGASYNDSYYMSLTYDPNGNIQTMTRKGAGGMAMDVLTYKYITQANGFGMNRNQLNHVDDAVVGSAYTDDLEDQNLQNYDYDEIGQLAKDDAECIADIQWTPYRKVKRVVRTNGCQVNGTYPPDLEFEYNAQQQRIMKLVKPRDGSGNLLPEDQWEYTYYSYDAAGNVLAIYERKYTSTGAGAWEDQLKVKAFELYGSSHVGTYGYTNAYPVAAVPFTATLTGNVFTNRVNSAVATTAVDDVHLVRTLGNRMYQLANHLGNVLSVVTDRKLQVDGNNNNFVDNYLADVLSSTDYYPFGQEMPGRTFSSNRYRYGYNGMEKDDEMKGSGNSYTTDFRMYDPRLGRWMSQDPIVHEWESPYAAFANNPIYFADPSGLEGEGANEGGGQEVCLPDPNNRFEGDYIDVPIEDEQGNVTMWRYYAVSQDGKMTWVGGGAATQLGEVEIAATGPNSISPYAPEQYRAPYWWVAAAERAAGLTHDPDADNNTLTFIVFQSSTGASFLGAGYAPAERSIFWFPQDQDNIWLWSGGMYFGTKDQAAGKFASDDILSLESEVAIGYGWMTNVSSFDDINQLLSDANGLEVSYSGKKGWSAGINYAKTQGKNGRVNITFVMGGYGVSTGRGGKNPSIPFSGKGSFGDAQARPILTPHTAYDSSMIILLNPSDTVHLTPAQREEMVNRLDDQIMQK